MQTVSLAEFNSKAKSFSAPVQIEDGGTTVGKFIPAHSGFFSRLFGKKDDTVDGVHRPSRQLRAALRESRRMEKHPERYKSYNSIDELYEELGIKI